MADTTPDDFLWGAATSAYQVEGAAREFGRGESIWDRFAAQPGKIADGSSGEIAADHYHRLEGDLDLMSQLGLRGYRFSVAWPRIQPTGRGRPNAAGFDFYERLVEGLLERGIRPLPTLYHWDLPWTIQNQGGWTNTDTIERFVEYADLVAYRLGDRVYDWITLNEPFIVAYFGHVLGTHAPRLTNPAIYPRVAHNLLLAHGRAVPVVRGHMRNRQGRVGIALNLSPVYAAADRDEDEQAAVARDGVINRWYLDALFKGAYPADVLERMPLDVESGDMAVIATPIDFLGLNYYTRQVVRMGSDGRPEDVHPSGSEHTAMGWEVYPRGLYDLLVRLQRDYNPPLLYITEIGAAFDDAPGLDGAVDDVRRVAFLEAHVEQARHAVADGSALHGMFIWSLLDNWEWAEGFAKRFGLVYVDYETQQRTIKSSGRWYARLIEGEESQV